jgi:hypothetical protein
MLLPRPHHHLTRVHPLWWNRHLTKDFDWVPMLVSVTHTGARAINQDETARSTIPLVMIQRSVRTAPIAMRFAMPICEAMIVATIEDSGNPNGELAP